MGRIVSSAARRMRDKQERDLQQLAKLVRTFEEAWSHLDFALLESLWDLRHQDLYYVSETLPAPLRTAEEVRRCWKDSQLQLERLHVTASDLYANVISGSLGVIAFQMHADSMLKGFDVQGFRPLGTDTRVSAICRRERTQWRIFHYVEAPLAPLAFLRRIYNHNVSTGFVTSVR